MHSSRSLWRVEVGIRIQELRHRLAVVEAEPETPPPETGLSEKVTTRTAAGELTVSIEEKPSPPPPSREVRRAHLEAARQALTGAAEAVDDSASSGLREWWTGTAVTAGWEYVHEAQAELVELETEEDLRATLPALSAWMQKVMPEDGRRKHYEKRLGEFADDKTPIDRTLVRQTYRDVILANNEKHANLRLLRNRIMLATLTLLVLLSAIGVWHAIDSRFISLCGKHLCVSGGGPHGRDVFEIELIGAIGGLLSVALSLGTTKVPPSRYDPRVSQLLLKPVAGAATALVGVLFVQSELFIAPPKETSEWVILAYAAFFGFSQELLTKTVDKRADALLAEPTKKKS